MNNSWADAQSVATWKSPVLGVLTFFTYLYILFNEEKDAVLAFTKSAAEARFWPNGRCMDVPYL